MFGWMRWSFDRVRTNNTLVPVARPTSTTFFEDAASEALYGNKDLALAVGNTSDGAEVDDYGNTKLAKLANPHAAPASEIASGDLGEIRITLTFAGWYATTEWVLAANTRASAVYRARFLLARAAK